MLCLIALFLGNVFLWCTSLWFIVNNVASMWLSCAIWLTCREELPQFVNLCLKLVSKGQDRKPL